MTVAGHAVLAGPHSLPAPRHAAARWRGGGAAASLSPGERERGEGRVVEPQVEAGGEGRQLQRQVAEPVTQHGLHLAPDAARLHLHWQVVRKLWLLDPR